MSTSLLGLLQRGLRGRWCRPQVVAGRLQPVDLVLGALGGAGQSVEDVDEVLLAQAGVGVVDLGGCAPG